MGGKEGEENREGDFGLRPQHSAVDGKREGKSVSPEGGEEEDEVGEELEAPDEHGQ